MRKKLVGEAGKSGKEAAEVGGLRGGGREEKTKLECRVWGRGERPEMELEMTLGSWEQPG